MANKTQKQFAEKYLKDHPDVESIWLNVEKNEWFTDKSYAENSRAKDSEGKPKDKLEVFSRKEDITVDPATDLGDAGNATGSEDEGGTGSEKDSEDKGDETSK